jgi:glycosyltransferase involved in cell wall biosynthesis
VDVLHALAALRGVRWVVIGAGPERERLAARAEQLRIADRVEWTGPLPPAQAMAEVARCHVMAMPSVDEAFGVAYTEALACGLPAIGCAGEPGPEEIAALTDGMRLVPPRDPEALGAAIEAAIGVTVDFSPPPCGPATIEAYGVA